MAIFQESKKGIYLKHDLIKFLNGKKLTFTTAFEYWVVTAILCFRRLCNGKRIENNNI